MKDLQHLIEDCYVNREGRCFH